MKLSNSVGPLAGSVFSLLAATVQALEAPAVPLPDNPPAATALRDPFTPSALMYETAGAQGNAAGGYGFLPNQEAMKVPKLKLRGLLNPSGKAFIALLEVGGVGTFMVREGDEFNFDPSQPKNAIRVSKITRLSVTVETGTLGSIRVLR
ncbi:hypothetical protein [Methylomonas koyamae]|uniref:hypothetical protein n=1 Tax=Methylomonas koyamae TaxID=702114 RepID=UPI000B14EA7D|nr:hypothetical protein [Methylomonas koyamae]ATG91567.1 hypothetical protein MKLM6_3377 [Methylomonas koyamae]BBL59759.1 hypothetical protein MKFW12EY_33720 [Methylomonas koyamae]